ncbi:hypothetical protein BJX66DRAFT_246355 [Aspergillus keveii]|uniref:GPI inositol-deacylase winged helix domain-containing protein n=1 Tax=Aspergillus keveii TaxID=714993 RepID=A0ABR4G1E0_9EURO
MGILPVRDHLGYLCHRRRDTFCMDRLPKDLEETYHQCLKCIAPANSRALRVLKWVCYASRPLRIEELREAIAFDLDNEKWDHERIPTREFVVGCCANLVIEDPVDGLVRFAHPSVGQYLERNECPLGPWPKSPEHGRLECGEYCVAYLSFSDLASNWKERASIREVSRSLISDV